MWPFGVVEVDPLADDAPGLEAVGKVVQIDSLVFEGAPQPLDEDVVHAPARPSIEIWTPAARKRPVKGEAGELAALIGIEDLRLAVAVSASSSASTQKLASRVFDKRQASTYRLAQSMIATK